MNITEINDNNLDEIIQNNAKIILDCYAPWCSSCKMLLPVFEELSAEEKVSVKAGIKEGLEGLKGIVPGLTEITVYTEGLASSNADLMLDSTFEDEAALKGYAVHPAHVAVADGKVRPYTKTRSCLDFEL